VKIWEGAEGSASTVMQSSGTHFAPITALIDPDPERAAELSAEADAALARGDRALEARLILRALAWDPYLVGGRRRLHEAAGAAERLYTGPDPLAGARALVFVADAEELLADEAMLSAYGEVMTGTTTATLAIDATRIADEEQAGAELTDLVGRTGLAERPDIDLLAVTGQRDEVQQARLHTGAAGYYRRALRTPTAVSATVEFTPASLGEMRRFVGT
jgi:hypothetical protein